MTDGPRPYGANEVPRLDSAFYRADPVAVARRLLGQRLVVVQPDGERLAGLIVETEAYLGVKDKAAHTYGWRKTERTASMFEPGGTAYVFLNYGIHRLLNLSTGPAGQPTAILIRAVEPTEGLPRMFERRAKAKAEADLCSGPGKLSQALGIEMADDGTDTLTSDRLFVERVRGRSLPSKQIIVRPRIGVDYAGEWAAAPLRFYVRGNPHVSRR